MSYIIEPIPMINFLDESKLKLPRFQRKATWDKKQNFELCISVFQDYPVGVVIVNQEQKVSWLLDGRQRRNALITMRDNPVDLYDWAQKYIGFNSTADDIEVKNAYWDKVEKYLETEDINNDSDSDNDDDSDIGNDVNEYGNEEPAETTEEENSFDSLKERQGLQTLLDIILMVHQKRKGSASKWEQTFDFRKFIPRLRYAPLKNKGEIEPKLLRRFILELNSAISNEYNNELTQANFVDYYKQYSDIKDLKKFENDVTKKWENIRNSLNVISRAEKIFESARIGIIRLTNATPLDAQNIFSRINKGGTQLKAEELLSAKPYWNKEVNINDIKIVNNIKDMYRRLGIPAPDAIVRWDLAATLISRIQDKHLIFESYEKAKNNDEISMDEITLGFKLLSSIYEGGMSNKHVINLEKNDSIKWETEIDDLVDSLNIICAILYEDKFFKYYLSWNKPITKLLGNAIALEFASIMWLDWKEKGCPRLVESGDMKAFRRDARALFDKLVFEYATKTWRGSGDSKMAGDIKKWGLRILPVSENDWQSLINGACIGNYNGQFTTVKLLRPVLYYYYVITETMPTIQADISFDVDHIIPQEFFDNHAMIDKSLKDSLSNLALLPTKENITKKAKALNAITDSWLKNQISIFTGIEQKDFDKYSDITNINELVSERRQIFLSAFNSKRKSVLAN